MEPNDIRALLDSTDQLKTEAVTEECREIMYILLTKGNIYKSQAMETQEQKSQDITSFQEMKSYFIQNAQAISLENTELAKYGLTALMKFAVSDRDKLIDIFYKLNRLYSGFMKCIFKTLESENKQAHHIFSINKITAFGKLLLTELPQTNQLVKEVGEALEFKLTKK